MRASLRTIGWRFGLWVPTDPLSTEHFSSDNRSRAANPKTGKLRLRWYLRDTSTTAGDLTTRSANRKFYVQVLDSTSGAAVSTPINVAVANNRYQEMKPFPDGSVAYPAPGSASTKIKILRVMACQ